MLHVQKSLLFYLSQRWVKRDSDDSDIALGA